MRKFLASAALVAVFGFHGAAHAQSGAIEGRVDRLEREMRAVQRKVFPGGAGQTLEPQITAQPDTVVPGTPASSPVADLTQRVAALENQLSTLTGQVEQNQYRIRQFEEAFNAYKRSTDARLKALEDTNATIGGGSIGRVPEVQVPDAPLRPTTQRPPARPSPTDVAASGATTPAPNRPTGSRAEQLAAIERPSSGDPAEDGYLYGYRLWSAKLYPESRRELEQVVAKYPKHRRASYAQNLLGRAYLDAGAPSLAAVAFYENYKKNPQGERAPDSLYYLAQALTKLNKPASEICKVYNELDQLYGPQLSPEMIAGVQKGRVAQKCQ
jgi:TolA-binding protein